MNNSYYVTTDNNKTDNTASFTPLLSLTDISYSYNTPKAEIPALDGICLDIAPGSFTSIVGPSGCGKSTLLSIICGLLKPDSGYITSSKYNTDNDSYIQHIGYMPQKDTLFEWRTIYANVTLGLEINHLKDASHLAEIDNMLKEYGLYQFRNVYPNELSGGMRQRAALIRTLALNPDILLLDEPFSALDYQTRLEVSNDIGCIIKEQKKTALLVTHDISEAISMGDRVVILSHRPARIKKIINIELSINNRTPFSSRQAPEFAGYFNEIWEEIQ